MSALDSGHYGPVHGASNEAALDRRGETVDLFPDFGARCFGGAGDAALSAECQCHLQMAACDT